MSEQNPKPRTLKFDIGETIKIGNTTYKIIGIDDGAPHPYYKKWDYLIVAIEDRSDRQHVTEEKLLRMIEGYQR
jgi:hypothetical protein